MYSCAILQINNYTRKGSDYLFIDINNILKEQNKTLYWLAKQTDISYDNIYKLANNRTESIKFLNLEKICKALKCTPNDIFILPQENINKEEK